MKSDYNKTNEKILDFIIDYITYHGYSPTVREICNGLHIPSTSTVHYHLDKMFQLGVIETDAEPGSPRAIRVPRYKFVKLEEFVNE